MSATRSAAVQTAAVQTAALQTAAGFENMLIAVYTELMGLPMVAASTALVAVLSPLRDHHADHSQSFNAMVLAAGASPQTLPDPVWLARVRSRSTDLTDPVDALQLAAEVEDVAVATYTADALAASTPAARALWMSVAAVEAQHGVALRSGAVLLRAGLDAAVGRATDLDLIPAGVGMIGAASPDGLIDTAAALPADEGAVR